MSYQYVMYEKKRRLAYVTLNRVVLQKIIEERNGHEVPLRVELRLPLQTGWR